MVECLWRVYLIFSASMRRGFRHLRVSSWHFPPVLLILVPNWLSEIPDAFYSKLFWCFFGRNLFTVVESSLLCDVLATRHRDSSSSPQSVIVHLRSVFWNCVDTALLIIITCVCQSFFSLKFLFGKVLVGCGNELIHVFSSPILLQNIYIKRCYKITITRIFCRMTEIFFDYTLVLSK